MGAEPDIEKAAEQAPAEQAPETFENEKDDKATPLQRASTHSVTFEEAEKSDTRNAALASSTHSVTFEEAEAAALETSLNIQAENLEGLGKHGALSVVSKKYDLDGKGYLDDNEKVMRQYDKNNDGTLDLREVYKIVEEVRKQQQELNEDRKKILNLKKIIIGLVVFSLLLTLAMLGVSFAAAVLAKDTTADQATGSLQVKATKETVSTVGATKGAEISFNQEAADERRMSSSGGRKSSSLMSMSPVGRAAERWFKLQQQRRELRQSVSSVSRGSSTNSDSVNRITDLVFSTDGDNDVRGFTGFGSEDDIFDCLGIGDGGSGREFTISRDEYNRIRTSYFGEGSDHQSSIVLKLREWNAQFRYTIRILEGYHNEDSDQMFLLDETRFACEFVDGVNDICEDTCKTYQPIFYMGDCTGNNCGVWTCSHGLGTTVDQV